MRMSMPLLGAALALFSFSTPALAQTMFGSLSNFDVINDTGEICRGFEIELEGVSPPDIAFTFGNPYIRYGDPAIVATGTGTIVRYASAFGGSGWAVGTPIPSGPFPTGGHECFYPAYGGDPNYETLGGEHFGIALNGNPTNTIYRWLLGDASGNLSPAGSNVKIPAPIWNVQPPANPANPAAVQAVIPALPKDHPEDLFGEAMWVKVFVIEAAEPVELHHLVPGDPGVPDGSEPAEIEIEWQLLQAGKNGIDEVDSGLDDFAADSESITRRYEFYKYIGPYNAEGEAQIEDAEANPTAVGEFLGAQNAALNLAPFVPVTPVPGDFDSDGDVDGADFVAWQTNFPTADGATLATGDADGDGDVDGVDFDVWQTSFPYTPGPVPEPTALFLGLLSIPAIGYAVRCRRKSH